MVFCSCARDCSFTRLIQPGIRGTDEFARFRKCKLVLAFAGGHAQHAGFPATPGPDGVFRSFVRATKFTYCEDGESYIIKASVLFFAALMEMINESEFIGRRIHKVVNIGIGGSDLDRLWPTKRCGITTSTR